MPPLVQIKIDQTGKPAGLPGVAREDLATGTPVTLTAVGGPFRAYRWTIIDKALNFDNDTLATSSIVSSDQAVTSMSPIDQAGTYLVQIEIDSGNGLGRGADDKARITFYAGPTLATEPTELPQRIPAARETTEHNVPNDAYPGGNSIGWAYAIGRWFFGIVRRLFRVAPRAGARVATEAPATVNEIRKLFVSSVTFDGTTYTVTLETPFPDAGYGAVITPHQSGDFPTPMTWEVSNVTTSGFNITFYDNTMTAQGADFTVMVGLGDEP